ncbi:MAG: sn-glycerol-1-phosphate dehydrogenase [Ruminococcaceae bacterium]|nr:sn-glycerol-1-phosphate dehydrogenase [Oscillospiraceae bacterium]
MMSEIKTFSMTDWLARGAFECTCGKIHESGTKKVVIEKNAVAKLPALLAEIGGRKPFLLSGHDTFAAAGEKVCAVLDAAGISYGKYVFSHSPVLPTEHSVGSAVMNFDYSCDCIVGIGSGVINDIGKILAKATGRPYLIVGTAPSMDGYASPTSSMELDGRKVSLDSTFAYAIIGDLDILCKAPMKMLQAGVGDMIAKYIALCEWRIGELLVDEYRCPVVDGMVETALERVVEAAAGLLKRDENAVKAVMEGMVITGIAMKYAGVSRPASGMEHYFSHIWDMRALALGTQSDLHGIQCGIGTLLSLKIYDYIRTIVPNREKALSYVANFDLNAWNEQLSAFIGPGAQAVIEDERKAGKYNREKHAARLERILANWDEIMEIVNCLPRYDEVLALMNLIGAPISAESFDVTPEQVRKTFTMTKDIRDKYIASRLLWDLGLLEDAAQLL